MIINSKPTEKEYDTVPIYKLHEDEYGKYRIKIRYKEGDKDRYDGNKSPAIFQLGEQDLYQAYNGMVHEVIKVDELSFKEEVSLTIILLSLVFRFDNIRGCNLFNSKLQRNLVWDDEGGAMYYKLPEEKGPELDLEAKTKLERHINLRNVEPNLYQGFKGRVRGVMDSDRLASNYCSTENSLSLNFDVPGEMINQPIFIVKFSVVDNYIKDLLSFNWVKAEKVMKTCPANTKYKINGQSINFYRFLRLYLYKQVFVVLQLFPACKKFKLVVTEMYARIIVDQILEVNAPTSELMIIWHAKLFGMLNYFILVIL
ncbi:uncharacterized protein LOC141702950 isoform X1 [Apium graveolens]|uniref:uncharacterized protein LOC141702950 isoform X1 n=1 Tax=Apium graveolens TaxID=4045 RepID=UPI003D795C95